jgi:hypothetical protein
VLGRHVESLNLIELMLGDKPPLSPVQSFYQRILASDPDEVAFQAEGLLKTMPLLDYYEDVALPALALAQIDVARGVLEPERQAQVCDAVERVLADLSDHVDVEPAKDENPEVAQTPIDASPAAPQAPVGRHYVWLAAHRSIRPPARFWCSCSNGREFRPASPVLMRYRPAASSLSIRPDSTSSAFSISIAKV